MRVPFSHGTHCSSVAQWSCCHRETRMRHMPNGGPGSC
jgi:hypothetical protein